MGFVLHVDVLMTFGIIIPLLVLMHTSGHIPSPCTAVYIDPDHQLLSIACKCVPQMPSVVMVYITRRSSILRNWLHNILVEIVSSRPKAILFSQIPMKVT